MNLTQALEAAERIFHFGATTQEDATLLANYVTGPVRELVEALERIKEQRCGRPGLDGVPSCGASDIADKALRAALTPFIEEEK